MTGEQSCGKNTEKKTKKKLVFSNLFQAFKYHANIFLFFYKNFFKAEYQDIMLLITIKSWKLKHCIVHLNQ